MTLNVRERALLAIIAAIVSVGSAVRLIAAHRPEWIPQRRNAPGPAVEAAVEPPFGTAEALDSLFVNGKLDLNRAGPDHLVLLPGIGPALADRIVRTRERLGAFDTIEAVTAVKGIGPKTLQRLAPFVVVRPRPPDAR